MEAFWVLRHLGPWCSGSPGAVYICTEDIFPSKRLQQLISQQQQLRTDVPGEVVEKIKFSNQIFIEHAADVVSMSALPAKARHSQLT
jgi:hypothetical protein